MDAFFRIKLENYIEISSNIEMKKFLEMVGGFHDSIIKEMHIVNQSYIDTNLNMTCRTGFDSRMLIQRQWQDPSAVEFLLIGVTQILIKNNDIILGTLGEVTNDEIILSLDGNMIVCRKLFYKDASDWMGKDNHL